ncbi:hypothetical protein [Butyrivibrio sp. XBB1001]|uniref:hypothetical protein n=1 Tax=Butyrivibrio sp. XBB1001 TaxID=1280682 RepID=UPI0004109862|nr:hypothetical protein [Butyrivibrio sp. XBB1001]
MGYETINVADSSGSSERVTISKEEVDSANTRMETVKTDVEADQSAFKKLRIAVAPTYEGESAQSWYDATMTVSGYLGTICSSLRTTIDELGKISNDFVDTDDAASDRADNMISTESGEG